MNKMEMLGQYLAECCPSLIQKKQEPMSRYTTFRIGGEAQWMVFPKTEEELKHCVKGAVQYKVPYEVIGNGSNLLVSDGGVDALVIQTMGLDGMEYLGQGKIKAGAGITLAKLAGFAAQHGLTGLEFAHGIPGTLGGGVLMNAGAYGGELMQVVQSTCYLDEQGNKQEIEGEAHQFSYRHSVFSGQKCVILSSVLQLQQGDPQTIREKMAQLASQRREKQPLEYPSAGSMFKRPEGYFAAALIEQCGLKGLTVGGAQVSEKHSGFVINRGGATCQDVLTLVKQVQECVFAQTGVRLEMEVKLLPSEW